MLTQSNRAVRQRSLMIAHWTQSRRYPVANAMVTRKLGYVRSRDAYRDFRKRVDYSEYGGAYRLEVEV